MGFDTPGAATGAPEDAQYLTTAPDPGLTNETVTEVPATTLVDEVAATSQATVDLTDGLDSDHRRYEIQVTDLVVDTDSVNLLLRVSTDGGSTFESGTSAYTYAASSFTEGSGEVNQGSTGTDSVLLTPGDTVGAAAGEAIEGTISLSNPASGSVNQLFRYDVCFVSDTDQILNVAGAGRFASSTAVDAIRLLPNSGNIDSGVVEVIGVN